MDWSKFNTQLRNTVDTGKIIIGTKETFKECLIGDPKFLVVSSTIRLIDKKQFEHYAKLLNIRIVQYPENGFELGSVCGKPFNISVLAIKDFGQSSLLDVLDSKDEVVSKVSSKIKVKAEKKAKKENIEKEKAKVKKLKEIRQKEEEEKPIMEDEALKGILKIKKKWFVFLIF